MIGNSWQKSSKIPRKKKKELKKFGRFVKYHAYDVVWSAKRGGYIRHSQKLKTNKVRVFKLFGHQQFFISAFGVLVGYEILYKKGNLKRI